MRPLLSVQVAEGVHQGQLGASGMAAVGVVVVRSWAPQRASSQLLLQIVDADSYAWPPAVVVDAVVVEGTGSAMTECGTGGL